MAGTSTNKRVQVVNITVPVSAAGTIASFEETLRSEYERCIGYAVQVVTNTNNEDVSISISTSYDIVHDYVHFNQLQPGTGCPMSDRYHKADFKSRSEKITIRTNNITAVTAAIVIQVIFLLEK